MPTKLVNVLRELHSDDELDGYMLYLWYEDDPLVTSILEVLDPKWVDSEIVALRQMVEAAWYEAFDTAGGEGSRLAWERSDVRKKLEAL